MGAAPPPFLTWPCGQRAALSPLRPASRLLQMPCMTALGHTRKSADVCDTTASLPEADLTRSPRDVAEGPILLQKSLMAFANGDSVALMRFAAEASDDGAAQPGPGAAFLFVLPR